MQIGREPWAEKGSFGEWTKAGGASKKILEIIGHVCSSNGWNRGAIKKDIEIVLLQYNAPNWKRVPNIHPQTALQSRLLFP